MNVPLLDLKAQYAAIKGEVEAAIREVLESQHFILGRRSSSAKRRSRPIRTARTASAYPRAATLCSRA